MVFPPGCGNSAAPFVVASPYCNVKERGQAIAVPHLRMSGRFQRALAHSNPVLFTAVAGLAGFATYFAMYAFRKPFTAATFALVPAPWNVITLFINGLPLGMIWGLVFGFMEGRRVWRNFAQASMDWLGFFTLGAYVTAIAGCIATLCAGIYFYARSEAEVALT
jgi:hypothetical protein